MKRQLIEIVDQEYLVECDNPNCDYKVKNPSGSAFEDVSHYLNLPCPMCGENLLTERDYLDSLKVLKTVIWLNKWFSWLMFFVPKNSKTKSTSIRCYEGVKIEKVE